MKMNIQHSRNQNLSVSFAIFLMAGCCMGLLYIHYNNKPMAPSIANISFGMSLQEVNDILGSPIDRKQKNGSLALDQLGGGIMMRSGNLIDWWYDDYLIQGVFDDKNNLIYIRKVQLYIVD